MAKKTPQDRVGHKVPTPEEIKELREKLQGVTQLARTLGPALTKDERRRLSRPRRGSDDATTLVLKLARQQQITSRSYSAEGMQNDQTLMKLLEPAVKEAYVAWLALRDVFLQGRSEYWDAFLHFYGALSHISSSDAEVSAELEPVVELMKLKTSPEEEEEDPDLEEATA
jgi:hypothetical protein